jgi:hypothetical protein
MSDHPRNNLSEIPGKAAIWSDEDGLSWVTFDPEAEINGEDVAMLLEFAKRTVSDAEYFRVLVDLRSNPVISKEARDFAAGAAMGAHISAFAILASDLPMRLVGNFFIHFHKPDQPTKVFTEESAARKWLLEQKDKRG